MKLKLNESNIIWYLEAKIERCCFRKFWLIEILILSNDNFSNQKTRCKYLNKLIEAWNKEIEALSEVQNNETRILRIAIRLYDIII